MKGRPTTSNEMKRLNGTDQPCRMKEENESIIPLKSISISSSLKTPVAKKIFRMKADLLISLKVLTALDVDMLVVYAQTADIVIECIKGMKAEKVIDIKNRNGVVKGYIVSPYLKIYKENSDLLIKLSDHFGFSPLARTKMFFDIGEGGKKKNKFEDD